MNEQRRYDEAEVAEILERATARDAEHALSSPQARDGLTLTQLQEIGAEVGIPAARIAEAAGAVARRGVPVAPAKTVLGMPRSVARIVPIRRPLTDDEWHRLVVDLRETFGAQGEIESHGDLRSWTNGNLHVHVEPDGQGFRVRMGTLKGDAVASVLSGTFAVAAGGAMALVAWLAGKDAVPVVASALLGLIGIGQLGYVRVALPRWAGLRARQMDGLAERIPRLLTD